MKIYHLVFFGLALVIQVACGTKTTVATSAATPYLSNGVCYQSGQVVSTSVCNSVSALSSAGCNGTYLYCPSGYQAGGSGCQAGTCTTTSTASQATDNCKGYPNMFTTNGSAITCP